MQDDAERVRGFIHYKHPKAATAACGFSGGIICHPSWDKVSCPDCLQERLKERRLLAKEPLFILALVALGVVGAVILYAILTAAATNPYNPY